MPNAIAASLGDLGERAGRVQRLLELSRRLTLEQWQTVVDRFYELSNRPQDDPGERMLAQLTPEQRARQEWFGKALPILRTELTTLFEAAGITDTDQRALTLAAYGAAAYWISGSRDPDLPRGPVVEVVELPPKPDLSGEVPPSVAAFMAALRQVSPEAWQAILPAALEEHRKRIEESERQREEYRRRPEVIAAELAAAERQSAGSDEAEFEGAALGALAAALITGTQLDDALSLFEGIFSRAEIEAL
jgi:hypothetical protein